MSATYDQITRSHINLKEKMATLETHNSHLWSVFSGTCVQEEQVILWGEKSIPKVKYVTSGHPVYKDKPRYSFQSRGAIRYGADFPVKTPFKLILPVERGPFHLKIHARSGERADDEGTINGPGRRPGQRQPRFLVIFREHNHKSSDVDFGFFTHSCVPSRLRASLSRIGEKTALQFH